MSKTVLEKLLNKLKAANNNNERKEIISYTRSILTDDELDMVNGGDEAHKRTHLTPCSPD